MGRKKRVLTKQQKRKETIKLIVQDNDLVEAKYMFDVWEMRFFYTLVSMIDKSDDDEKIYRIWYSDIKKLFCLDNNKNVYHFLREGASRIIKKTVKIGWKEEQGIEREREYTLFSFVDYLKKGQENIVKEKEQYIDVMIHSQIRPFLLYVKKNFDPELTRYTSYDVRNIVKLKPYGVRLYELFKQYEYKGERIIIIEVLRDMFNLTDEYNDFYDFYRRIILKSVKDINKYTDLYIPIDKIEKLKRGRRVYAIRFVVETKSQDEIDKIRGINRQQSLFDANDLQPNTAADDDLEVIEEETEADRLFHKFEETVVGKYGITPVKFVSMLSTGKYDEAAIQQAINVTNRAKFNQKIRKSVAGFFMLALKDGYTDEKVEEKKRKKEKEAKNKEKREKIAGLQMKKDTLEEAYAKKLNEKVKELNDNNPSLVENAIIWMKSENRTKTLILKREKELGREMEIEDFKKSKSLRGELRNAIILSNQEKFADIAAEFQPTIKKLEKQIASIQKNK